MAGLSSFLKENAITSTKRQGQSQDLISSPQSNITTPTTTKKETSQNNGGFFGGLGYLGQKASLGFLSSIEGIWDYTAGGIAKLFGADDWAEQQFANDWTNYNAADEWYNPSEGWKIAGDVAGGIGTSLPAIAGVGIGAAIAYFSGGTLSPLAAGIISASIAGFGAAGTATKEAYKESGQLTGKEFGYGALSGATEAAIELASSGLSKGSGRIVNELAKKAAKETTETVAKTGAKTVLKQLGEDFAQEAIEEGLAEILSPVYQQLTYNPDAENATLDEVTYAALVGGLSGMIMSGSRIGINATVNTTDNYLSGKNAQKNGTTAGIIESGKTLAEVEAENDTGIEAFQSVRDTYNKLTESLKKHNGISTDTDLESRLKSGNLTFNTKDLMYLGKLKKANTIARLQPFIERSAQGLILNPEGAAQRYSAFGMKDANGKPINVTADEILSGIDSSLIEKAKKGEISKEDSRTLARQMRKALSDNSVLATLAVAEATGKIMVDTRKIAESIARGENLANTADLNRLIEKGKPEEMQALGRALGITDWATVTQEELRARVAQLNQSGGLSELAEQSKRMRRALEQGAENAKPLPHILRKNMEDGVYRYASEDSSVNMAILKEGDRYRLYDYDGDNISRELTVKDVNKVLNDFWTKGKTTTAESMQSTEQTDTAKQTAAIDAYARENIPEYKSMSEPNKAAVRMTIRQAQANGVSAEDTLLIAKVAAKSGLNIIFDAKMAFGDGSISGNTIYINPNNSRERTYEVILSHEMFHKLFAEGGKKAMNLYTEAKKLVDSKKAKEVEKKYKDFYKKQKVASSVAQAIAQEEVAAAGVEEVFKSKEAWEYILVEEPTFADKVLSFFRKSARDYSSIQGLSSQARKFVRQYKKLFDSISESNKGNNSLSIALEGAGAKKMPVTNTETDSMHVTGDNDKEAPATTNADVDTDTRYAIKYPNFSEADISSNMDAIADMEAVATIDASKLEKTGKSPMDTFNEYFSSLGNNITSDTFGDIALPKSSAKSEIRHGITAEKIASIEAIPAVIEQGKVIFHKAKEGGVERIVVCAPIKIGEADYYMGVMLQRDARYQRLYLHNVVSVAIEREATSSSKDNLVTTGALENENHLSITSIIQKALNVKAEKQKSAKKPAETSSGKRFALPETDSEGVSLSAEQREFFAESQIRAVEKDGYAEISPEGSLLPVYHGTNSGEFYEFDKKLIGSANDSGWYGRGFYFAFSEYEAGMYGKNVLKCYLNIKNPFNFSAEMQAYDGIEDGDIYFDFASFVLNMARKFPDIAKTLKVEVVDRFDGEGNAEGSQSKNFLDLAHEIESIYNSERLTIARIYDGDTEYFGYKVSDNVAELDIPAEIKKIIKDEYITSASWASYLLKDGTITQEQYDGILDAMLEHGEHNFESYYIHGRFKTREQAEKNRLSAAITYLSDKRYSYIEQHLPEYFMQRAGKQFNEELRRRGYDGVIQSTTGDEIVAFEANQIKLASNKTPSASPDIRYALPESDSEGTELTSDQRKYFDASKQLDSEGRLQVMYQGAPEEFFTFDKKKSKASNLYGRGFYFTNSADQARHYGTVRGYYLNVTNPLSATKKTISRMQMRKFLNAVAENEDYSIENYGTYDVAEVLRSVYEGKSDFAMLYDVSLTAIGDLVEAVELFNEINGTEYDGFILDTESVIFRSEQAKLTSNAAPSSNPDIRYALTDYTEKQYNSFGWVRANDVISEGYWNNFTRNYASVVYNKGFDLITPDGEYMIEIYDQNLEERLQVIDHIVFAKGHIKSPTITKILKIYEVDENKLSKYRENIYDLERRGIQKETSELYEFYRKTDFGMYGQEGNSGEVSRHSKRLGTHGGTGSGTAQKTAGGVQGPVLQVVHTFTDVTGKKRNVVKVSNNQYMIEGDTRSKYQPTIEAAVKAENNRIFERYARKHDKSVSFVRAKYAVDNDFLKNFRYALPLDEDLDAIFGGINTEADADGASFDIDAVLERGIPRKPGASDFTIGEMKKTIANNTHYQVYSKTKALEVISKMSGSSDLSLKTREKLADALWQGFNDCTDVESRRTFARDMAEYIVATMVTEAKVANPDVMEAQERLSYLAPYIGRISFHPEYLSEIRHIADKAGLKKILGRWGYKGKKGTSRVPMDIFAVDIAREMPGMSELENMHPVEAFMELNAMYENAKNDVKDKWISAYLEATDEEMLSLVSGIESDIMSAFETEGDKSKFAKLVEEKIGYYSTQAQFWKAEHDKIKGRDRILGLLMSKAQRMKDLKLGTFANATQIDSEIFKNSIEKLAKIQFRGNLNKSGTREILSELKQWYRKNNELLEYVDDSNTGLYVQSIADMLEALSEGGEEFTNNELMTLYDVMSYFVKFVENYGKVFRNGKMIEALPEAQRYISIAEANQNVKVGLFAKVSGSWYAEMFNDPAALVRRMDYYERGFYTEMFEELRNAAVDAEVAEMRIMRGYDEFLQDNKKYIEKASEELVEYRGRKIPKLQLIDLYMTMKRKHSWAGIALNGFTFKNLDGKTERVPGFVTDERISQTELESSIKEQQAEMAKHFTESDRQYMSLLEKGYNEDARKLKADRDLQRLGFTNATSDYYYPIRRAYTAQNVDKSDAQAEYDRVTNSSFNKDTVKGAKQEIAIESADSRFRRHIHAVCQYSYLSPAVETFNRLYNMDTSGNKNRPISVRTASENVWTKGHKYFVNLISDIQGIPRGSTEGMAALSFIRGSYAKFQLGANPKVWLTQLSSLFASSSILDADSITRGVALSAEGIDQYCPLAELRSYDNTAAMAQAVIDKQGKAKSKAGRVMGKVNKFSDALMIPIGKMDRFVLCRLFGACQVQVEKNGGAKVGTEANKIEAGKLLKKVILETQQNSIATERSKAMRHENEFLRTVTMFTADSMKVMGRVVDAFGEISVLRAKLRTATDANIKADLESRLKNAIRNARKSTGALVLSAIFMASIAQLFRHIYDKEQKEDESVAETMIVDAVGNLFGGLPLIKDVYARIFEGYGFDNYAYSTINDLLDSTMKLFDTAGNIISGSASSQDVANGIKNLSYSIGQLTGLPVRNVYNVFYGLTKRFSPETAYKIDNAFYVKNYKNDFYKAIENDDAEMASFILGLLYNERLGTDMSESVHNELYSLSASGYKVIPKAAPKSITIDGEEYELTDVEQEAVRGSYSESQDSLEKLFATAKYLQLTDEKKTEAIKYVYDLHYGIALQNVLGIDGSNSVLISSVVGVDNLALLYVDTKGLTSDTDKLGNTISGSKRTKVVKAINKLNIPKMQKLLLICASGYAIKDGDIKGVSADSAKKQLLRYILSLKGASKEQKAELAKMCGFEVKNGKIITKNTSLSK